ncbi:hypothetical protein [Sphingobacterium hotanense]|uniref:hypothetical protein n=1 Tax=Sphingobacterium hotanense TaxID=649196 RepID=UPI0021A52C57|nr:hypothetical protein [Sphingobacterium hotanense]MCT1524988.1 hypothetical protein [Sphingobacterium hotanense]
MKPLEIHCRNRVMYAQLSVNDRGLGMRDYNLTGKDGLSLYIFCKEQGEWKCAYGYLDEDIKQAIIDALILRFDWTIKDLFYLDGERHVVEIRSKKGGLWHIYDNNRYIASISYDRFTRQFEYHLDDPTRSVTEAHLRKYTEMIKRGEITWQKEER